MSAGERKDMKGLKLALGLAVVATAAAGNAHAALLGVTQSFPDVTLAASPYIIYNHTGVNGTTGQLLVVTGAATLTASTGGANFTQAYLGTGHTTDALVLTIDVNNSTGAFVSGNVGIGFGINTTAARFAWQGNVTSFGFAGPNGTGTIFDAKWTMTSDQYQNIPSNMSQFVNGYLTGRSGGLDLTSTAAWNTSAINFGTDWVYGANAAGNPSTISPYTSGLHSPVLTNSTIMSDVWVTPTTVPLPAAVWMLVSGLGLLAPMTRRKNPG